LPTSQSDQHFSMNPGFVARGGIGGRRPDIMNGTILGNYNLLNEYRSHL